MGPIFSVPYEGRWAYMRGVKRESPDGFEDAISLDVYTCKGEKTLLGGCINRLKYPTAQCEKQHQRDINTIVDYTISVLHNHCQNINVLNLIVPAPSNNPYRHKILLDICAGISDITGLRYVDIIQKDSDARQIKDINSLNKREQEIQFSFSIKSDVDVVEDGIYGNVLVVDDVFQYGTTMTECARVLTEMPSINHVYGLCITRIGWPDRK